MNRPYSDRAMSYAAERSAQPVCLILDAAHDREALGLDASVCAREFLNEVVERLRSEAERIRDHESSPIRGGGVDAAADFLLREFESNGGKP